MDFRCRPRVPSSEYPRRVVASCSQGGRVSTRVRTCAIARTTVHSPVTSHHRVRCNHGTYFTRNYIILQIRDNASRSGAVELFCFCFRLSAIFVYFVIIIIFFLILSVYVTLINLNIYIQLFCLYNSIHISLYIFIYIIIMCMRVCYSVYCPRKDFITLPAVTFE